MLLAKYLWILGSLIFLSLGSIHLWYTFFTDKFFPAKKVLLDQMKETALLLTKETTLWQAWIGFNASHSMGAIYIGLINLFLVFQFDALLQTSYFFYLVNILTIGFYVWLARKYWFSKPFIGILITFCCYTMAAFISLTMN